MAKNQNHKELLENEWYHVRHSGEIPEIALHSSLHYLTKDNDGPNIDLAEEEHQLLSEAAAKRFREIILRDILPENRDTSSYRGVLRSICNWRRYKRFCERNDCSPDTIRDEFKAQLLVFLQNEVEEVTGGSRLSCINCSIEEIQSVAVELDLILGTMQKDLERICLEI